MRMGLVLSFAVAVAAAGGGTGRAPLTQGCSTSW